MKTSTKSSAEYELRIHEVYTLLLSCASRQKIWQYVSQKWMISKRSMDRMIAEATRRIESETQKDETKLREKHIRMKTDLYNRAYADKNWALCKEIEKDMAEFFNLYPEKTNTLNLNSNKPISFVSISTVPQRGVKLASSGSKKT